MNKPAVIVAEIIRLLKVYLVLLIWMSAFRTIWFYDLSGVVRRAMGLDDFISLWIASFRFDTVVIFFALLPLALLVLAVCLIKTDWLDKYTAFLRRTMLTYSFFVAISFLIINTFDYFFYTTYGEHFSPVLFGLADDKTSAILVSMWTDYPVIRTLLIWTIAGWIIYRVIKMTVDKPVIVGVTKMRTGVIAVIFFVLYYFTGLRGFSFEPRPLDMRHASVTDNEQLNLIPVNGVFALKNALSKGRENAISTDYNAYLKRYGFRRPEDALKAYKDVSIDAINPGENPFFARTETNEFLQNNPPNVVVVLMESFGTDLFEKHSGTCNLLGELSHQLPYCKVFKNFLSADNVTVNSLENLITGTLFYPLSQSPYQNIKLSTSVVEVFKKAGYETTFVFGGLYTWRNTGGYMKTQGFDRIITQRQLEKKFPGAEKFLWGIHDEYLYAEVLDILKNARKPQFIFVLTVSNHTPYDLPSHYQAFPLEIKSEDYEKMTVSKKVTDRIFKAYQYAAHQAGSFLKQIRSSVLGRHTIVAFTGDHNLHQGFKYDESEYFHRRSVPLILYIPEPYDRFGPIDTEVFGSHKDVFPTLFHLSLSGVSYFDTGTSLLRPGVHFSANRKDFFAGPAGAVKGINRPVYYRWKVRRARRLERTAPDPELNALRQKAKAYLAATGYKILKELDTKEN